MGTPWSSDIIRVSTGALNTVSDDVIGGQAGIGSISKFSGQLGKRVFYESDQIDSMYSATVGTLYAGRFRYVRRRATDDASPALAAGKIAFWDTVVTNWQTAYQVTTDTNLSSTSNAMMRAGIFIGNIAPGDYGFIQDLGEVYVRFRSVLTGTGAPGVPVYAADTSDVGLDQGTLDVLTTDSTALANGRYMGLAVETPTASGLKRIILSDDAFAQIF